MFSAAMVMATRLPETAIAKGLMDIAHLGQPNFSVSQGQKLWNQSHQPKFLFRLAAS
jgi:hypothetical protein